MSAPSSTDQLQECLRRADLAMQSDDLDAANAAMAEGAALCVRMQDAGLSLPADSAGDLRRLAEECENALVALSARLNARSFRDDQQRRGMLSYQRPPR